MDRPDQFIKEPNLWSENPRFRNEEHAIVLHSCHEVENPAKKKLVTSTGQLFSLRSRIHVIFDYKR